MKPSWIFMILIACPAMSFGQSSTMGSYGNLRSQTAVGHSATSAGGGGLGYDSGWGGTAQTAEGAALQGASQVIGAAGQYNQATSAAAVNMTQAQSGDLRNQVQAVRTFWEMRDLGRAEREKERGPRPTPEELVRRARAAAPRPLNASQYDRVSGELYWPAALMDENFLEQRVAVDECMARWARYGTLDYSEQAQVRQNIDAMYARLKSQITAMPPQEYVAGRSFLESVLFASTRAVL